MEYLHRSIREADSIGDAVAVKISEEPISWSAISRAKFRGKSP